MNAKMVKGLLEHPVTFHPTLARMVGSVSAGLLLSQAIYWTNLIEKNPERFPGRDGWFYKSQLEWEEETCLGRWEQESARKSLRRFAFWQEKRRDSPAKLWFRVDLQKLAEAIEQYVGKPHSRMRETSALECGKTSDKNDGKPQSLKGTETTTEITSAKDDDFHFSLYETFRKQFSWLTPCQFRFAVRRILSRAKTPPRSEAFLRKSLAVFLKPPVFSAEIENFLVDEACGLQTDESLSLGDVADELKRTAAENELPYTAMSIDRAIENARQRTEHREFLARELRIGEFTGAEVATG